MAHQLALGQPRRSDQLASAKTGSQYLPKIDKSSTLSNLELQQVFDRAGCSHNFSSAADRYGKAGQPVGSSTVGGKYK